MFRELALFAACGFLLGAIDNIAIDLLWFCRMVRRGLGKPDAARRSLAKLPRSSAPGGHAIFIPAWDEAGIIGPMLEHSARQLEGHTYRIFVGCYPNDPETIADIEAARLRHPNIQRVTCSKPGPTTKADCLNALWHGMVADEIQSQLTYKSVILHDAEDLVDRHELQLFDRLIDSHDLVQIPVIPLPHPQSPWIAGHYCDEFAEAHGKDMPMRSALGASVPSAGVGCAIARSVLGDLASRRGGSPFDPDCLTEDYELGLTLAEDGRNGTFVRYHGEDDGELIAVRAHFPASLGPALRQKTRWVAGISLFGWDRLGWNARPAEFWMRLRDRCTILTALFLTAGYSAAVLALIIVTLAATTSLAPAPLPEYLSVLLAINFALLLWRLAMRALFSGRVYGWRSAIIAIPRVITSNILAIMVARRAIVHYLRTRMGARPVWEKTRHVFPTKRM